MAFKAAGAVKVAYYGMPWEALGGHPYVISPDNNLLFILLYLLCGVGLPLLWLAGYEMVRSRVHLTEEQTLSLAIVGGKKLCHILLLLGKCFVMLIRITIRGIKQGIKDIIAASSTKVE